MERTNFEKLRVYKLSEKLADKVWEIVWSWSYFARDTGETACSCGGLHWFEHCRGSWTRAVSR